MKADMTRPGNIRKCHGRGHYFGLSIFKISNFMPPGYSLASSIGNLTEADMASFCATAVGLW